jgi:hypothetical protein
MNWDWWLNFASFFRDMTVGIGALFGGAGAFKILSDWRKERQKQRYKNKYIKRFAAYLRDPKETAIWKNQNNDKIYAVFKPDKTRQHITPWSTFVELGYSSGEYEEVSNKQLEQYKLGEPIDFS